MDATSARNQAIGVAKKMIEEALSGIGVIKGSNCYVKSYEINEEGNTVVTFGWLDNQDVEHTLPVTVLRGIQGLQGDAGKDGTDGQDGKDGENGKDGTGIVGARVENNHLYILLSDGTEVDAGLVPTGGVTSYKDLTDSPVKVVITEEGKSYLVGEDYVDFFNSMGNSDYSKLDNIPVKATEIAEHNTELGAYLVIDYDGVKYARSANNVEKLVQALQTNGSYVEIKVTVGSLQDVAEFEGNSENTQFSNGIIQVTIHDDYIYIYSESLTPGAVLTSITFDTIYSEYDVDDKYEYFFHKVCGKGNNNYNDLVNKPLSLDFTDGATVVGGNGNNFTYWLDQNLVNIVFDKDENPNVDFKGIVTKLLNENGYTEKLDITYNDNIISFVVIGNGDWTTSGKLYFNGTYIGIADAVINPFAYLLGFGFTHEQAAQMGISRPSGEGDYVLVPFTSSTLSTKTKPVVAEYYKELFNGGGGSVDNNNNVIYLANAHDYNPNGGKAVGNSPELGKILFEAGSSLDANTLSFIETKQLREKGTYKMMLISDDVIPAGATVTFEAKVYTEDWGQIVLASCDTTNSATFIIDEDTIKNPILDYVVLNVRVNNLESNKSITVLPVVTKDLSLDRSAAKARVLTAEDYGEIEARNRILYNETEETAFSSSSPLSGYGTMCRANEITIRCIHNDGSFCDINATKQNILDGIIIGRIVLPNNVSGDFCMALDRIEGTWSVKKTPTTVTNFKIIASNTLG